MSGIMPGAPFTYAGSELTLFEKATRWKAYWRDEIAAHIQGDVLEVGAGIGANTKILAGLEYWTWTCLEPDAALAARIESPAGGRHRIVIGTIGDLPHDERFDAILYIDVLEHIADDRAEMVRARDRLNSGGSLIVLSPAHPSLYTPFDAAIGHYRRYTRSSLRAAVPPGLHETKVIYLDSAGMLASAGNRLLLRSSLPTEEQILAWDRVLVPISRVIDGLLRWHVGKSILGVWQRGA